MKIAKPYSDDEYYTTEEVASKFFELIVKPSGILKHRTILMPFSKKDSPLYKVATKYHKNIISFAGDKNLWAMAINYDDVAVIDNPPFSMSKKIEQKYFNDGIPFVLFRSAVSYPKFILKKENAGIIYENSNKGVMFDWGVWTYIANDQYINENYPNLINNLKSVGVLQKNIPIGFSFYKTNYTYKVNTVTFSELCYPKKKDLVMYVGHGVYDENTEVLINETDGRIHLRSK